MVRVVFDDDSLDMVPAHILQLGIECKKIKMFYRHSEKKWITVGVDPVRQVHNSRFQSASERRMIHSLPV